MAEYNTSLGLSRDELVKALVPSSTISAHKINYIALFEELSEYIITYLSDEYSIDIVPMKKLEKMVKGDNFLKKVSHLDNQHRWKYHGGNNGVVEGWFSPSDDFVICYPDNTLLSITRLDLPHYYADNVDFMDFIEWLDDNPEECANVVSKVHTYITP